MIARSQLLSRNRQFRAPAEPGPIRSQILGHFHNSPRNTAYSCVVNVFPIGTNGTNGTKEIEMRKSEPKNRWSQFRVDRSQWEGFTPPAINPQQIVGEAVGYVR